MNVRRYYTWESYADTYVDEIRKVTAEFDLPDMGVAEPSDAIGRRLAALNHFVVVNIDNTLIGGSNDHLPELLDLLQKNRKHVGFAVATGRTNCKNTASTRRTSSYHRLVRKSIMARICTMAKAGKPTYQQNGIVIKLSICCKISPF